MGCPTRDTEYPKRKKRVFSEEWVAQFQKDLIASRDEQAEIAAEWDCTTEDGWE
jgi:hypothetical protein